MASPSKAIIFCGVVAAIMAVPSRLAKAHGRGTPAARIASPTTHDPQLPLMRRTNERRRRHQRRHPRKQRQHRRLFIKTHILAAFAAVARPSPNGGNRTCRRARITPHFAGESSTSLMSYVHGGGRDRRRSRGCSSPPAYQSTVLAASEPPADDCETPELLSPAEILQYVKRVEHLFDLPPGGIPAGEVGFRRALPLQVLECIRSRHGLEEFAGGRRLLDPEYDVRGTGTSAVGQGEEPAAEDELGKGLLFPGLRLLHAEPIVIGVDYFFTPEECDGYISKSASPLLREYVSRAGMGPFDPSTAAVVDPAQENTSTTFIHQFSEVPELMAKASALMGVSFAGGQWEEAQTVRYRPGEEFAWHLDAMSPTPEMEAQGGQRIANLLVFLNDLPEGDGGGTIFKNLALRVRPRKGSALVFFPSFGGVPGCPLDPLLLHAGEMLRPGAGQDKWIAQLRLRKSRTTPIHKDNVHAYAESAVEEFDKMWRASGGCFAPREQVT